MTPEDIEKTIELLEKTATTCEELAKLAEKYPVIKTNSTKFRELCNPEQKERFDSVQARIDALPD